MADPDYFTLAELRALPDMDDVAVYSDEALLRAAAHVTGVVEREVGTSFIYREHTETFDGGAFIDLGPYAAELVSVTVGGDSVPLGSCHLRAGMLRKRSGSAFTPWTPGLDNVEVTWRSGYSVDPPADVKEQTMLAARFHAIATSMLAGKADRSTSLNTEMGTFTLVMAGGGDHPTGYPEVDAMIVGWRNKLDVFGFA